MYVSEFFKSKHFWNCSENILSLEFLKHLIIMYAGNLSLWSYYNNFVIVIVAVIVQLLFLSDYNDKIIFAQNL